MLPVTYDPILVASSVFVAIMASFTGLRLASGLRHHSVAVRKQQIAKAAIALGGGIWSMHFIGMLAVQLPVAITYDALATLGSALVAILITGLGLLALHFGERSRRRIALAGVMTGLGIFFMHFIGMSGIGGGCYPSFDPKAYLVSGAISIGASIAAFWMAYRRRTIVEIALGAVLLGLTVSSMHYSAMVYTSFIPVENLTLIEEPNLSSGSLALIVAFAAFLVCGLFLFSTIPNEAPPAAAEAQEPEEEPTDPEALAETDAPDRLPYEVNGSTRFIDVGRVRIVRADGHYSWLHDGEAELFCPRSISRLSDELEARGFLRTHRSYLIATGHIAGFEREGDRAYCLIDSPDAPRIPVSRSRIKDVRSALSLA